jgi:hypothetical protein
VKKNAMKCFLKGAAGAAFILIAAVFATAMYCDYSDRVITTEMLESVEPMQAEIEARLSEPTAVVAIDTAEFNLSPYIKEIIVSPNGAIGVQGGKSGQMFMLIPTKVDGTLSWRCIGGTYDTMPPTCRTTSHFTAAF